jgi:hypothetical protein
LLGPNATGASARHAGEVVLRATAGVLDAAQVRLRWIFHHLRAECEVIVDAAAAVAAHTVARRDPAAGRNTCHECRGAAAAAFTEDSRSPRWWPHPRVAS